ncbi:MAG: hypothetical protein GDA48_09795 [Hormoscilla sp. GM102CHS1]|nr:hypothetical protein [Hormoscilla sp. GM102CHS1]
MTHKPQPPSLERVKQRAAKMDEINKRWDALIVVADYIIAELEADIRKQPLYCYRLSRAMSQLNMPPEKMLTS